MTPTICLCGKGREASYFDEVTRRGYCSVCASSEITSSLAVHMEFISDLVPIELGERVECRTMGEFYDGTGVVVEISTELRFGGTPVNPAYLVEMDVKDEDEKSRLWFTPICLTRTARRDKRNTNG